MSETNKTEEITENSGCSQKSRCQYLHLIVGVNLAFSILTFCMLFNVNHEMRNGIHRFSECHPPRHKLDYRNGNRRPRRHRDRAKEQHNEPESSENNPTPVEKD